MIQKEDLKKVIVFGGTTEGRQIAEALWKEERLLFVCVATEYGEVCMEEETTGLHTKKADQKITVRVGRLDEKQIKELLVANSPTCVIDATHPYAVDVTKNIRAACRCCHVRYFRVHRRREEVPKEIANVFYFCDMDALIQWLNQQEGIIFSTLGVKEAEKLTEVIDYKRRVFVRILPVSESLSLCEKAGFDKTHIIGAKGPFSQEQNEKMLQEVGADILLTKDSGRAGGFLEKLQAANNLKLKIAVLGRPDDRVDEEVLTDFDAICKMMQDKS